MPDNRSYAFDPVLANLDTVEGAGLRIAAGGPAGAVAIMAYRGSEGAAGARLATFADSTPDAKALRIGPGTWLVLCDKDRVPMHDLDDVAATFDQGDGYALLRLHGPAARKVLQKGIFVDLDAALASDEACVCSVIAHINVIVWRISPDTFGVAVPRSYAGSFWHWLGTAAADEGIAIGR